MKNFPINQKLSKWTGIQKKQLFKYGSLFMVLAILNLTLGCHNYLKVRTSDQPDSETITQLNNAKRTFIVHYNQNIWKLSNVKITNDTILGLTNDYYRVPTLKPIDPKRSNRYLTRANNNESYLVNEVHLYLDEYKEPIADHILIPISAVNKIEIYNKDKAATTASYAFGIGISTILVVGIIALLSSGGSDPAPAPTSSSGSGESCPFIYTWDGINYQFSGEIYSGAIHLPLERNDYLKLPSYAGQEAYSVLVKNEVKEIQHTNLLELVVIDHPINTSVLIDKYGDIATLNTALKPTSATNMAGEDIMDLVVSKDSLFYRSHLTGSEAPLKDAVIMQFPLQLEAKSVQLAIHARNSMILDLMMGQFHDLMGLAYDRYVKRQNHASADEMRQWSLDQGMPLSLFVERNNTWEFVDYYNIAGPMKFKEDVLSIPLKGNESDPLKVKLEFGNFLWEIDGAWVDYSPRIKVNTKTIPVYSAITEDLEEVTKLLQKDDNLYYTQPSIGNQSAVTFMLPEMTKQNRTHNQPDKGYYQIHPTQHGKLELEQSNVFKKTGHSNPFVNTQMQQKNQLVLKP